MIENIVDAGEDAIQDEDKLRESLPVEKEMSMKIKMKKVLPID